MAQSDRDNGASSNIGLCPHDPDHHGASAPSSTATMDKECESSLSLTGCGCSCVVLVLVGLPGAGKSTVADAIRRRVSLHSSSASDHNDGCDRGTGGECGPKPQRVITTTTHSAALPSCVKVLSYDDYIDDPARSVAGPAVAATVPLRSASLESNKSPTVPDAPVAGGAFGDAHGSASVVSESTVCDEAAHEAKTYSADRRALVSRIGAWLDACQGRASTDELRQVTADTDHNKTDDDYRLLVIDDNMYYTSMRYAVYQAVRARSAGFATMMLQCDVDTAQERNRSRRTSTVHPDVICRMAARIEPPRPDKNGWVFFALIEHALHLHKSSPFLVYLLMACWVPT